MVVGKKKVVPPRRILSNGCNTVFDESTVYQLITRSPADEISCLMREALFNSYEDVHLTCPDTGRTYLHLLAEHCDKFSDARALPVIYQLCYAGIDISLQDKQEEETALHKLVRKPGTHKLIIALLRYGIDVNIKNRDGQTAQQILETERPPGHEENLHWFRKICPGLFCFIPESGYNLSLEEVERLLKCWCKVSIFVKGKPCNLLQVSQMRAKDALLAELLKKHYWTNEFVHATLAGLPDEMKRIYKEGKKKVDVDTKDHCYQLNMESPIAPQPLVAAAWEQSNYDVIDQLLLLEADVCDSYTSQPETNMMKPLFYQTLLGTPRVNDVNIMLRILQEGDLRCKTETSSTFLHESVNYGLPAQFVCRLFALDVPLEERDQLGKTARELAVEANKPELVQVMDDFVIQLAREGDVKRLENLVLNSYELNEVRTADGKSLFDLAEAKHLPSKSIKLLSSIPEIQTQMLDLWSAVYRNDINHMKKYLNSKDLKRVVYSRNRLGRSILLQTIVHRNKEAVRLLMKKHPKLIEYFDNYMLTCLHYAYIMFEDDNEPAQLMQAAGASVDWCCTMGNSAYFFRKDVMDEAVYRNTQEKLFTAAVLLYPNSDVFKTAFTEAAIGGNLSEVRRMEQLLKPYGSVSALSSVLFDVIDNKQEDMAIYLLEHGCDKNITKQYETCSPSNELCAMMECFHPKNTLSERATVNNLPKLAQYLSTGELPAGGSHNVHTDMEVDDPGANMNFSNNSERVYTAQISEDTKL